MKYDKIILIGFMGSGKSSVAKRLASFLEFEFIDTDSAIELESKMSVKEIFEHNGEPYFRELEQKCLNDLKNKHNIVLSAGGGMPIFSKIDTSFYVVYINVDFHTIQARMNEKEREKRPLFNDGSKAKELFESRQQRYEEVADYIVNGNRSVDEIVDELVEMLA